MKNLRELIGADPVLGCPVAAPGQMKGDLVKGTARGLLGAAGHAAAAATRSDGSASPFAGTRERFGYLAITADDVILLATKPALVGHKAVAVLARTSRRNLVRFDIGEGTLGLPASVVFADGSTWDVEVPKLKAKEARQLAASL